MKNVKVIFTDTDYELVAKAYKRYDKLTENYQFKSAVLELSFLIAIVISGYIAINADKETIYGVYFNHEGETAGLGAEIKDNQKWQQQFCGKHLFADGNQDAVALSVCKKVDNPATQVDGVSGATLTCDGVTRMIHEGLGKYLVFLKDK